MNQFVVKMVLHIRISVLPSVLRIKKYHLKENVLKNNLALLPENSDQYVVLMVRPTQTQVN